LIQPAFNFKFALQNNDNHLDLLPIFAPLHFGMIPAMKMQGSSVF